MEKKILKTTVFAKKKFRKDGKPFYTYFGRFTKKDGTEFNASIQFYEPAKAPEPSACPLNIEFVAGVDGSRKDEPYTTNDGETRVRTIIKLTRYDVSAEPFVDHSMDDLI